MKSSMLHSEPDEECLVKSPKKGIHSSKKKMLSLKENESSDEEGLIKSPPKISTTMKNPTLPNPSPAQDQINAHVSSDEEGLIISPVKNYNLEFNKVPALSHIRKKQKVENVSNPNNQISYSIETKVQKCRNSDHLLNNVDIVTDKSTHAQISYVNRPPPLYKIRQKSKLKEMSNPTIPAGVKFPSKWSNSTIYNYSTAIKATTSEIDDKKESDSVNSSKGPRRSRPSIKVAFKSPAKRNSHVKKNFPKERQSYSRYEVKPNPPFRTLYSARAARRYNLGPRISPPRNSPYNLSRSTIDCHRVESKHIPDNYIYKETEKSFWRETTSKVYEGSRYSHGYKSNKDNVLTRNDSEAFDKSSNLNNRSDKVSDDRLNKSQIYTSETSFNEDFHSIQNVDENVSKNIKNVNEKNQECEGQISETNIHLISETNKETLSHDKYMKDDNPQNPDFSVRTMPDKYPSSFRRAERGNKFDKQRFPYDNPSVNNTEKLKDRESLNKDKFQEPNTGMLTMPDNVLSSFKRAEDKNRNQKQNSPCNKSDVCKTEESRKETFVNQNNVHNPDSYVLIMPDNIPSSFRRADKNRNQKQDSPSNRSNVNKTEESKKEKFVNQDSIHNPDSYLLTMPDNVPTSFRRAEDKNENQKHNPPCDKSDVSKTEESRKGTFVNQDNIHNPGSYVLTMPDNIPSSFKIVENKNRNQKQKSPSNRSNVYKTEESRKGAFVNQDNVHNLGSYVLTSPDNMPSSFRKTEDKNRNQKQKSPSNRINVNKTEESRKGTFVNQDNIHNPGSYMLTMPDNIPSSFKIVENKNRNQKQKSQSNRSNVNKTEESRKVTVNQGNVHNPGSHVLTMPDNMPSTFRKAEDTIRNQKQKSPSNRSNVDKTEELRKEKFVNQDNIHNPSSYVLTMPDNIPSSFRIVEKKNRNQKQKLPSNRSNFNKTEELRKGTFVNQDNIYNPISYLSNMPDKVLSSFRGAENKNGNQKQKFPCNISNNMPKSSNKGSVSDGKVPNSNNFLLITMHEKRPSSLTRTETENQISPCSLSEDNQIKKAVNNDKIQEQDTLKLTMSDKLPSSLIKAGKVNKLENVSNVEKAVDLTSSSKHVFSDGKSVKDDKLNEKSSGSTFMDKTTEFPPRRISVMENSKNNNEKLKSSENKNLDMPNSLCDSVVENAESICSLEKAKLSVGQTPSSKSGIGSSSDKKHGLYTPQNVDLQTEDRQKGVPEGSETLLNSENCIQGQIQESGRSSVDQNELEQAVAFLTHNAGGESQESVTPPSQNNSNISSESRVTAPKDFASLWTQMSELFSPTESQTETPSTSRSKAEKLMVLMNQMKGFALGDVVQQLEKQKGS
ncbi:hypothetical protein TNIN_326751 [Trichonephila inaurata madagascariensis]|uniref:Uncharacterized protein n=1 Tax=Trichonephila inaurata madagascariensis TaxID=2747483 RepID=A0A8X7BUY5_9ARAC|nr:hypothetical protein TNIN_326751 [Trichonephila inaurata madagascariensis]